MQSRKNRQNANLTFAQPQKAQEPQSPQGEAYAAYEAAINQAKDNFLFRCAAIAAQAREEALAIWKDEIEAATTAYRRALDLETPAAENPVQELLGPLSAEAAQAFEQPATNNNTETEIK